MLLANPSIEIPTVFPAIVQIKRLWADDWQTVPELEFVAGSLATGGERSQAQFRRRYGEVKLPWAADYETKYLWQGLSEWWVRVLLAGPSGYQQAWIGQIVAEPTVPHSPTANGAAGYQELAAEGPERILFRTPVSRSYWLVDSEVQELGFAADFNSVRGLLQPNRSWEKYEDFGDSQLFWDNSGYAPEFTPKMWTAYDIVEYLLHRFCSPPTDEDDGPAWSIAGAVEPLEADYPQVRFAGRVRNVGEILAGLIGRKQGLDWCIRPTADGFQVEVFCLAPEPSDWLNSDLPANTTRVPVNLAYDTPASVRIVHDDSRRFKKIRVLGERIVVCASLYGAGVLDPSKLDGSLHPLAGSLAPLWPGALEAEYKTVTDQQRAGDRYRTVWSHFGPPDDWDFQGGLASPKINEDGTVSTTEGLAYQRAIRETLDWTPLQANVDYTVWPIDDDNATGEEPQLLPPAVWIEGQSAPPDGYDDMLEVAVPIESLGVNVSVDATRLAVQLDATPRHWLASGHDTGWAQEPEEAATGDYEQLLATIAWRTDHRWGYEITADDWTPADGVHEEIVEGAECWVLAPQTVVGTNDLGQIADSGDESRVLRIDEDAIRGRLAGILARYYLSRSRASIEWAGLAPWSGLVGQMLDLRDGAQGCIAPITGVQWRNDPRRPTTRITAGLAR